MLDCAFPFVTFGRSVWANKHAFYDFNHRGFGSSGVSALKKRQRQNLLLVAPQPNLNSTREMIEGAVAQARLENVNISVAEGISTAEPADIIRDYLTKLLRVKPIIDGLICASPFAAIACIAEYEKSGLVLQKDFDVYARETAFPLLQAFRPGILVVIEDMVAAGEFLAQAAVNAARIGFDASMQKVKDYQ
jgi:LacI family transcriptional regulator